MFNMKAYSAVSASSSLAKATITRCDATEHDVQIEILKMVGRCATAGTDARPSQCRSANSPYGRHDGTELAYRFERFGE
jgi:alcohol dehydrogenase (NADP+)